MPRAAALVVAALVSLAVALPAAGHRTLGKDDREYSLPDDLLIGAGTSAVQTEGAWDKDGEL